MWLILECIPYFRRYRSRLKTNEVESLLNIFARYFLHSSQIAFEQKKLKAAVMITGFDLVYNPMNYRYQLKFYYFQTAIIQLMKREKMFDWMLQKCLEDKEKKVKRVIDKFMREFPQQSPFQGLPSSVRNSEIESMEGRLQSKTFKLEHL